MLILTQASEVSMYSLTHVTITEICTHYYGSRNFCGSKVIAMVMTFDWLAR